MIRPRGDAPFPPGYQGCLPRHKLDANKEHQPLTFDEYHRLEDLSRGKLLDPGLSQSAFTTSWGFNNSRLGYFRSNLKIANEDVIQRMNAGEVARNRPIDDAIGRNIKYGARHTASTTVIVPDYATLDRIRLTKEAKAAQALSVLSPPIADPKGPTPLGKLREAKSQSLKDLRNDLGSTDMASWPDERKGVALGRGGYGPWCGSLPRFSELRYGRVVKVEHRA
jgi:hypothetical protein